VFLHFNSQSYSIVELEPEVTAFVSLGLGVSVPDAVFALNFLLERGSPFCDAKDEVVLQDLR
jgi:hypothetical protein